jgi:TolB protein
MSLLCGASALRAQDSTGVRLGINYPLGSKPGVIVLSATRNGPDSIRAILQRDLDYDDRATVIALDEPTSRGLTPANGRDFNFALFGKLGAVMIVYPRATLTGLTISLYDVANEKLIQTKTFPLPSDLNSPAWRLALHSVADQIGLWVFGSPGAASTRILYVLNGHIWIVDADGANVRQLTSGLLDLSPAWHPSGSMFAYSGYSGRGTGSQIAIRNFTTGETHWKNSSARGLNITPTFSPDGRTVVYAHGLDANTDLVMAGVNDDEASKRLTVGRSINTSPTFSPDGRRIAYMSGRPGHPEIYTMDADGTNAQLLTEYAFGESSYRASPDWSPDGRTIAYQTQISGAFQIMTIDLRDGATKQYTSNGTNEDPSWSPDGRHIVFSSTRSGPRQLWVIDVASGRLRQLTRQGGTKLPAWSPLLKRP